MIMSDTGIVSLVALKGVPPDVDDVDGLGEPPRLEVALRESLGETKT